MMPPMVALPSAARLIGNWRPQPAATSLTRCRIAPAWASTTMLMGSGVPMAAMRESDRTTCGAVPVGVAPPARPVLPPLRHDGDVMRGAKSDGCGDLIGVRGAQDGQRRPREHPAPVGQVGCHVLGVGQQSGRAGDPAQAR
jgi:hypothetical protein